MARKISRKSGLNILGKKGELTLIKKGLGSLSAEERPLIGQSVNIGQRSVAGTR